jgi:hypothetical protein
MADHLLNHRPETHDPATVRAPAPAPETTTRDGAVEIPSTTTPGADGVRELAVRESDGIQVRLTWYPGDRAVWVSVSDARTGDRLDLAIPPERALHAFHHPFVYAA